MTLARHEWGEKGAPALVCLHGVTSHGRHFAKLAERLAARFHVVAFDLRGHGRSSWEPPWNLEQHVADVLEAAPDALCAWLGHSFGGRVVYEAAAAAPERVERLVLLDPAIRIPPDVGLAAAERARHDRSYVSFRRGSIAATRRVSSRLPRANSSRRSYVSTCFRTRTVGGVTATVRARSSPPTGR